MQACSFEWFYVRVDWITWPVSEKVLLAGISKTFAKPSGVRVLSYGTLVKLCQSFCFLYFVCSNVNQFCPVSFRLEVIVSWSPWTTPVRSPLINYPQDWFTKWWLSYELLSLYHGSEDGINRSPIPALLYAHIMYWKCDAWNNINIIIIINYIN